MKEEIEKNPARYVDSELYSRNNQRSPAFDNVSNNVSSSKSEVQSTTLNIGGNFTTTANTTATSNSINSRQIDNNKTTADNPLRDREYPMEIASNLNENSQQRQQQQQQQHKSCQVCLVKELRQDLMNLNKIIKDRNDQLMTKLKAKRLRSFFERQI